MSDPIVDAMTEYMRAVGPAYEVIRRARARLATQVGAAADEALPFAGVWSMTSDPTEPNGAEYALEAAIEQPAAELIPSAPEQDDPPPSAPEQSEPPPVSPRRHARESFVCSRCPMTFKTRGWRDRHEAKHPPVPDIAPAGGQRIRRTPPVNGRTTNG